MKLYAEVKGLSVYSSTQLQLTCDGGYWDSGSSSAVNQHGFTILVTAPSNLTALLLEQAIADQIVTFFNNAFGTSFVRSDVVLINGGVVLFSL